MIKRIKYGLVIIAALVTLGGSLLLPFVPLAQAYAKVPAAPVQSIQPFANVEPWDIHIDMGMLCRLNPGLCQHTTYA